MLQVVLVYLSLWSGARPASLCYHSPTVTLKIECVGNYWMVMSLMDPQKELHSAETVASDSHWYFEGEAGAYVLHYWSFSGEMKELCFWVTKDTTIQLPQLVRSDTTILKHLGEEDYALVYYSNRSMGCYTAHELSKKSLWVGKRKYLSTQLPNWIKRCTRKKLPVLLALEAALLEHGVLEYSSCRVDGLENIEYVFIKTSDQFLKVYLPCKLTHAEERAPIVKALKAVWKTAKIE